jgi:hypothetical protein
MNAQPRRHRMRHRDMRHTAGAEERVRPRMGAVDKLIDQHERAGRQFRLEGAAGRQRNEIGHAGAFERIDIGAIVDIARRQPMALVVPREKNDRQAGDLARQ